MPIPLKFAQALRKNNFDNPLADEYKKFLGYKVFRLIPFYINHSGDDVLGSILKDIAPEEGITVFPDELNIIKITKFEWSIFNEYRSAIMEYTNSDEFTKKIILDSVQTRLSIIFPILKTSPLFWLDVLDTDEEIKLLKRINELKQNNDECIFIESNFALSTLYKKSSSDNLTTDAFSDRVYDYDLSLIGSIPNNIIIVNINIQSIDAGHATNMVIDNMKKRIYFSDSHGFNQCNVGLIFMKLSDKFKNYKRYPVMRTTFCPRGMFQGVSENAFCQTWSLFNSLLTILNRDKLNNINDIDEIFKEVLDVAKPICYYKDGMSDRNRLSLIILEFMFYVYSLQKNKFRNFLNVKNTYNMKYDELKKKYTMLFLNQELEIYEKSISDISVNEYNELMKNVSKKVARELEKNKDEWNVVLQTYKYHADVDSYISNDITDLSFDSEKYTVYDYISAIVEGKYE